MRRFSHLRGLAALFLPLLALAQEPELAQIKEQELEVVREQISALKQSMDRRAAERDQITAELQTAEVRISEKRIRLAELDRERQFSERKKRDAENKIAVQEEALTEQAALLEAQVRATYTSGSQERTQLLLNQHDPAELGRMLVYYRFFSELRGDNIAEINGIITALAALRAAAANEESRLAGLARARYAELTELNVAQEQRQQKLAALKQRIADEGSEVQRLAAQEKDLSRLIAELTSILSDFPISSEEPFRTLKGRLTWPVAGMLTHDFGQPRAGAGIKWNGVVLAAPRGREVRAVYHGRVVFADWLAGLGLLIIVDHGDGYMTLYGYNETTLKTVGDWVAPGDVIATVGESGGQQQPALYFELRQGTKPINPRQWFNRQPRTG